MKDVAMSFISGGLWILSTGIVGFYIGIWCYTTTSKGFMLTLLVDESTKTKFLGDFVKAYILYSTPIIFLAISSTIYLAIKQSYPSKNHLKQFKHFLNLLWTRPLIVNKIVGIINGFDIMVILTTTFMVVWMFLNEYFGEVGENSPSLVKWIHAGITLGRVSVFPISLLFLPISRSSPIYRMMNIPFEQALRYHTWLGHLTMTILLGHASIFVGVFAYKQQILIKELSLPNTEVSVLAGLIAFIVGLLMWTSALSYIRRKHFNLFYYVHQLYWIFFAFFVYHVGVKHAGYSMGSIFLYFVDRFFRFQQSRRKMSISNAKILSNGVVELKIPKSSNLKYNAISFLFINIPNISLLEWHPFSIASSSLDKSNNITIYIKPKGDWTQNLNTLIKKSINDVKFQGCPFATKFFMEGPYGHESNYFLRYDTLLLIGGGIGITPFLAIISDILHRYELEKEEDLPIYINLIWMVQTCKDMDILKQISPTSIFPNLHSSNLKIMVDIYVTKGELNHRQLEDSTLSIHNNSLSQEDHKALLLVSTSTRDNLWMLSLIISTTIAAIIIFGIFHQYVLNTKYFKFDLVISRWIQVSIFFIILILGIVGMGGIIVTFWNKHLDYKEKHKINIPIHEDIQSHSTMNGLFLSHCSFEEYDDIEMEPRTLLHNFYTLKHKGRPNFEEIFDLIKKQSSTKDIGVLASGPESLLVDVAKECQKHSSGHYVKTQVFNFHSVSFTL
ncbi:hypothetical protein M758_7G172500 [Ceratodon purpureus]|nr:hypothetical protein M758_7G172500 [Ceratodon purpureus]